MRIDINCRLLTCELAYNNLEISAKRAKHLTESSIGIRWWIEWAEMPRMCCAKRMLFPVFPPEERVKRRIGGSSRRSLARRTLSRVSPIHSRTIEAENKVRKEKNSDFVGVRSWMIDETPFSFGQANWIVRRWRCGFKSGTFLVRWNAVTLSELK